RMERVSEVFVQYTGAQKDKWFKDGKWTFPLTILHEAAKQQGLPEQFLRDGWGQSFKLVRVERKRAHDTGHSQFDHHDIVSAGPDRDYATADDLRWTALRKEKSAGGGGAAGAAARLAQLGGFDPRGHGRFGRETLLLRDELRRFPGDARLRGGLERAAGFPGGGGALPGGAPVPQAAMPFGRDLAKTAEAG